MGTQLGLENFYAKETPTMPPRTEESDPMVVKEKLSPKKPGN